MMPGLLYTVLFLTFGGSLCNPTNQQSYSPPSEYTSFLFPSEKLPENVDNTYTLSIFNDNPWNKPIVYDNRRVAKFAAQLEDFHKQLTNTVLAHKPDQNLIYSPVSISTLLMMVAIGSRRATLQEILVRSGLEFNVQTLFGFKDLIDILKHVDGVELEFGNVIFASENLDILPDYRNQIVSYLQSDLQLVNFENTESAANQINNWCKEQTKNQITEITKPDDLSDALLMLVNAIYFKGDWMVPFDVSDTVDNVPFFINKNKSVPVSMMHLEGSFNNGIIDELKTSFIELPYKHGTNDLDTFSMYLLIPENYDGLDLLEKNIQLIDFKTLDLWEEDVHISLPKFKIQSTLDIKPIFQKLGMNSMFTNAADFSALLDDGSLYLNKIVQKASLTVNEKGSTAAVISAGDFTNRFGTTEIIVDRPFICAIVLKSLGIPLFIARIVDPTTSG